MINEEHYFETEEIIGGNYYSWKMEINKHIPNNLKIELKDLLKKTVKAFLRKNKKKIKIIKHKDEELEK